MKDNFKNILAIFGIGMALSFPTLGFAKDGDRLNEAQRIDFVGQQAPMPGEYLIINVATKMCLGKNIVKETGKEILITLKCDEASVKNGNYKEFLSITEGFLLSSGVIE